jgi:hypothetical protein
MYWKDCNIATPFPMLIIHSDINFFVRPIAQFIKVSFQSFCFFISHFNTIFILQNAWVLQKVVLIRAKKKNNFFKAINTTLS